MALSDDSTPHSAPSAAARCLDGITIMLVDDSRSVSEAIRIMAVRSGARIRRADSLQSAGRHLMIYRPDVVIIDLALPDGSGVELARELTEKSDPRPAVLLISAAEEAVTAEAAKQAGADGYLVKPIQSFSVFQAAILDMMPPELRPNVDGIGHITADQIGTDALLHDLETVHDLLREALAEDNDEIYDFAAQFLAGVARTVRDTPLAERADALFDAAPGQRHDMAASAIELVAERMSNGWAKAS